LRIPTRASQRQQIISEPFLRLVFATISVDRNSRLLIFVREFGEAHDTHTEQVTVPLSPEQRAYVVDVATREQRSMAQVIRRIVDAARRSESALPHEGSAYGSVRFASVSGH
jgi:hypothetical protein